MNVHVCACMRARVCVRACVPACLPAKRHCLSSRSSRAILDWTCLVSMLQDDEASSNDALGALSSVQDIITPGTDPIFEHARVISKVRGVKTDCRACTSTASSLQSLK